MLSRPVMLALSVLLAAAPPLEAQSRRAPARRPAASQRRAPAASAVRREAAVLTCPSALGTGMKTTRTFCDVLTGRDPAGGVIVTIPPHRGTVRLSFDLHNRHTYSAELEKARQAYRRYTATIGVLTMDNTLLSRAVIETDVRTAADLFDRVGGGAGPEGVKAVAPAGVETIELELPAESTQVSLLGEKLAVVRPDGTDLFTSEGRPVATISNVRLEYRPAPAPARRRR